MSETYPRRQSRLRGRDYSKPGGYFVTLCTFNQADIFGEVAGGLVRLNEIGQIVADTWRWLPSRYPYVTLDEWCVMPNHLHGIVRLTTTDAMRGTAGSPEIRVKPVGRLVGAFKTSSTNRVNRMRGTPGAVIWQRNFWDRVIRDEDELSRIRDYIRRNPTACGARTFTV